MNTNKILLGFMCIFCLLISPLIVAEEIGDDFSFFESGHQHTPAPILDPFIGYNRLMTNVNEGLYVMLLRPAIQVYKLITPKPIRQGVFNFFQNILYPVSVLNNALQWKWEGVAIETSRFFINSTLGLGGVMDLARDFYGVYPRWEGFSQTLGVWGVGHGPYIVWPILGPYSLRHSVGFIADSVANPLSFVKPSHDSVHLKIAQEGVKLERSIDMIDKLRENAIDFYLLSRNAFYQNQWQLVKE